MHFPSCLITKMALELKSFLMENKAYLSYKVNAMATDDLVTLGTRASAAMVFTLFFLNITRIQMIYHCLKIDLKL